MINKCHLYLQIISFFDVLQYDRTQIHLEIRNGTRVRSRKSIAYWVDFLWPTKKYWLAWQSYLKQHIQPKIANTTITWDTNTPPNYKTKYYYSPIDPNIYTIEGDRFLSHGQIHNSRRHNSHRLSREFEPILVDAEIVDSLQNIEVTHTTSHISLLCTSAINSHGPGGLGQQQQDGLRYRYQNQPKSLCRLCGNVALPADGGNALIQYLRDNESNLVGVNDA